MTDQPPSSKTLARSLTVILIVAVVVAGYFVVKYTQANEQIASLTSQLGDSQKQIASLTSQLADSQKQITSLTSQLADSQKQITSLTSQLADSQKQIAELQPLANKALTLPIALHINRHALTPGYDLSVGNLTRESLRFHFTVGDRHFDTVIDGGKLWILHGLASGDVVQIDSEGYDPKTVTIQ
jgi:uncharacterized coiled-coil protein SlyX